MRQLLTTSYPRHWSPHYPWGPLCERTAVIQFLTELLTLVDFGTFAETLRRVISWED